MRKVSGLLLTLILLSASSGCLAEEIQEELEKEEVAYLLRFIKNG